MELFNAPLEASSEKSETCKFKAIHIYPDPGPQQHIITEIWAVVFGDFGPQVHHLIHLIQSTCVDFTLGEVERLGIKLAPKWANMY